MATQKTFEFNVDTDIPVLLVDSMASSLREDGMMLVRLGVSMPEGFQEQVRLMIPSKALHNMLDAMCQQTQHYPAKAVKEKSTIKKPSKS